VVRGLEKSESFRDGLREVWAVQKKYKSEQKWGGGSVTTSTNLQEIAKGVSGTR